MHQIYVIVTSSLQNAALNKPDEKILRSDTELKYLKQTYDKNVSKRPAILWQGKLRYNESKQNYVWIKSWFDAQNVRVVTK